MCIYSLTCCEMSLFTLDVSLTRILDFALVPAVIGIYGCCSASEVSPMNPYFMDSCTLK